MQNGSICPTAGFPCRLVVIGILRFPSLPSVLLSLPRIASISLPHTHCLCLNAWAHSIKDSSGLTGVPCCNLAYGNSWSLTMCRTPVWQTWNPLPLSMTVRKENVLPSILNGFDSSRQTPPPLPFPSPCGVSNVNFVSVPELTSSLLRFCQLLRPNIIPAGFSLAPLTN